MSKCLRDRFSKVERVSERIRAKVGTLKAKLILSTNCLLPSEADETAYWLELLVESGIIDQATFQPLRNDLIEIIALLTASIRTAKNNLKAEE